MTVNKPDPVKDASSNVEAKRQAALEAVKKITPDMIVGLGTGSTAAFAIEELGRLCNEGLNIDCCATSYQSMSLARQSGLKVLPVGYFSRIDISIDGADEVDLDLRLIKGGGAAHTNEKIVHAMSDHFVCVVDPSKLVSRLGEKFAIPVEVIPHSVEFVMIELAEMAAAEVVVRSAVKKDGPVITDNGNLVIDVRFKEFDPDLLESRLNNIPGVIDNGIFAKYRPHEVIIGESTGVRTMTR